MAGTPSDVVGELMDRVGEGRWTELAGLYAEDALVEHPLRRTWVAGRTAIGQRFAALGKAALKSYDVVLHATTDPEVVVAEYGTRGPGFTAATVQVVRVRDGLITHSRDYHDHLRMAVARGDVDELAERIAKGVAEESFGATPATAPPARPVAPGPPVSEPQEGSRCAVLIRLLDSISAPNPASRADLYADDAYVTHPFHPTAPALTGREELRQHFARGGGEGLRPRNVVFHEGVDPELIIAEFEYVGTAGTGNPVLATNVFVTRVRAGLIVESRDYADHVALAVATGQLPALVEATRSVMGQA
ncbi:nuclear transport factor 2 family protein [Actinophytocola oryzae]|uniref:Ketosteroid isomerase-like protein n=1 Tax=Actinophytocola oryzae TaxID=502181 RepID=A0A4R7VB38_9PSEU|nr:nuclear transport factor 2 family protein [Actinophytocola oryzae]TDV46157.1 ketosteroid isomerase-like protein [Actinophytocola oryzae]